MPLGRLPFVPYSPAQVLQAFLNTYAGGVALLNVAGNPAASVFLKELLKRLPVPGLADRVEGYLRRFLHRETFPSLLSWKGDHRITS